MVHAFLRKLLADAHRWGLLPNNPAALVDVPKGETRQLNLWIQEQVAAFLRAMLEDDNAYGGLFSFLLATGCRIGEALGLLWSDIDWTQGTIRIERQITELHSKPLELSPKTRAGVRTLTVPAWGMSVLHRQKAKTAQWRLRSGKAWTTSERVFTTTNGTVPLQGNVRRALHESCVRLGLPLLRIHDLRHISLSLLAMSGVPLKVTQQRAGHSNPSVTMQIYTHVLGDGDKLAAKALESVMSEVV
jgi:integrase